MSNYYNQDIFVDDEEDKQSIEKIDKLILYSILVGIAFIPLLIGGAAFEFISPRISDYASIQTGGKGDFYTYYKTLGLTIMIIVVLALLIYKTLFIGYTILPSKINYILYASILTFMISTFLSPFSTVSLWGMYNRSDGALVNIFYIVLIFAILNIRIPKEKYIYFIYSQIPFVVINFIMSIFYFLEKDLLNYSLFNKAMSLFLKDGANIESTSRIMGTLNQINYMSGTFGAFTLMFIVWGIVETRKSLKIVAFMLAMSSLAIVLMATSFSGFFTITVGTLAFALLLILVGYRKQVALYGGGFVLAATLLLIVLSIQNPRIFDETVGYFTDWNPFVKTEGSFKYIDHKAYAATELELPEIPESNLSAGSGRLYIWQETWNSIKERPLLGYGMDTLPYGLNQNALEKRSGMVTYDVLIDKPHNIYLGYIYGLGILGGILVILILLLPIYFIGKSIIRKKNIPPIIIAISALYAGYLLQGIANDNVIGNALVPFAFLGIIYHYFITSNEEENPEQIESR